MRVPQVSERIKEAPAHALRGVFAGIGQLLLITDKLRNKASHQDVPHARKPEASETVHDTSVTSPAGRDAETAPVDAAAAAAPPAAAPPAAAPAAAAAAAAPAAAAPAEAVAEGEAVAAEPAPAKPAARAPRTAAKPVTGKPVTAKPPAKPATAKPATPRPTAAKAAAAEAAESAGEAAPKPPKRQSARNFDKTGNVRVLGDEAASAAPAAAAAPEPAPAPEPTTAAAAEPVTATEPTAAAAPLPNYDELSVASLRARLRNLDVAQVRQLAEYERAHAARADVLSMYERRIAKLEAEA
jgi:hypothetical protein